LPSTEEEVFMERENKRPAHTDKDRIALPSPSDLRGRQSVRATFRLSESAIHTLSALSAHLSIKQKSLFDHLIQDKRSLALIASGVEMERFEKLKRVQKTFVISRKTLCCLNDVSKDLNAPRDALVEYSIRRLTPIVEEERERQMKRKRVVDHLTRFVEEGENLLESSRILLGEDDPVYERLESLIKACRKSHRAALSLTHQSP